MSLVWLISFAFERNVDNVYDTLEHIPSEIVDKSRPHLPIL